MSFSLIELITVVAIVAILAAILLPAMAQAKELTRRTMCGANMHQSWIATQMYADEQDDMLPPGYFSDWPVGIFHHSANYDLRTYLDGYLDYKVWVCSTLGNPPIDDPGNTSATSYSPWYYFPGFQQPSFFVAGGAPDDLRSIIRADDFPIMQDQVVDLTRAAQATWRFNHGTGETVDAGTTNPSFVQRLYPIRSGVSGTNITYYDGHTEWVTEGRLEFVGLLGYFEPRGYVYSTKPDIAISF